VRERERERERERTIGVGMSEGHCTFIIIVSSYVNLERVYIAMLWDKCYCLLSEAVPIVANDTDMVGPIEGIISFV